MPLSDMFGPDGIIRVLAVDHRDSMRYYLRPNDPDSVSADDIVAIKTDLVRAVSPLATGVMLEPEYSIPELIDNGALAPGVPFFAALESQGYLADPGEHPTTIADGWSVAQAQKSGAAMAKLLLPFHPDRPLAATQVAVANDVIAQCREVGIELVLEPLFYDLEPGDDRTDIVLRTVEQFAATGAALLKLPFPIDPGETVDPERWHEACVWITERCEQPWALLSAGCSFETFMAQTSSAIGAGASGYMVGRALWGEAATAPASERVGVITDLVVPRWNELARVR